MTGDPDMKRRVNRAVAWVGAASATIALIDVVTLALLLAFWVTDVELGIATLAVTLTYFLDLPTEAGLSSVLIQREKLDDDTISSVFWLNVLVSIALFAAMFGIGPAIGYLQGHPIVGTMLILYATKLLYQNVYFVPAALLRRELRFKELSLVRTIANFGDVAAKVGFAIAGEPIYCFVAGPLARVLLTGIGLQIVRPWRPRLVFRRGESIGWLKFGLKTTSSQYLQHFYNNVHFQVVGYFFGEQALAAFRVAYELVMYPVNFISNIVTQVAFPAFARLRGDTRALSEQFLAFSRQNLAVVLPILVVIAVGAGDILGVVFPRITEDGSNVARVLCLVGMLRAVDCLYLPLLDGLGLPGRNVMVAGVTSIVLFGCDLTSALVLDDLGFLAVAIARAVGYPLVITFHAYLALARLELGVGRYMLSLLGIAGAGVLAAIPGTIVVIAGAHWPAGARLAIVAAVSLLSVAIALQQLHGLGIRAMIKSLRG
jgi:O-antigen/teichoic acid export membrane protein